MVDNKHNLYIDVEQLIKLCRVDKKIKEDEVEVDEITINVFKYEIYKLMINRLFDEFNDPNEDSEEKILLNKSTDHYIEDIIVNSLIKDKIMKRVK